MKKKTMKKKRFQKRDLHETTKPIKQYKPKKGERMLVVHGKYGGLYTKDMRHVEDRYTVEQQKDKDGTIKLTMKPFKTLQDRRKELITNLVGVMAKEIDNKALMEDILIDCGSSDLERLHKSIKRGATVKSKPGCFYLEVKDKFRKKPMSIRIRK